MKRVPPILLGPDRRRSRATQAGALAVGLIAARLVDPNRPLPFEVCGFHYLTGLNCPTCGLTRALCHALRGEWAASVSFHPAGILLAVVLIGWMLRSALEAARGQVIEAGLSKGGAGLYRAFDLAVVAKLFRAARTQG